MEQSPFLLWTCLLGAGLALVEPQAFPVATLKDPRAPRLIGCVFFIRSNITCRWEPGDIVATQYTLQVQRIPGVLLRISGKDSLAANSRLETFTCTTTGSSCTIGIPTLKVRIHFCISIMAHGGSFNISSERRCQPGRKEVVLPPVILESVKQVLGSPQCLNVSWHRTLSTFPVSDSEIEERDLNSQLQFHSQKQPDVHVRNVTVTGLSFQVCLFKPDTSYIIRLRNRYQGPASPWSSWSNPLQGRTAEDAPSAAPVFWRQVKPTDGNGRRLVSLLWKPLPHLLANGRILFYNVTCQTENAQPLSNYGNCRDLHHPSTSCIFPLSASHCSCSLTASTSAGTSPEARIWLLSASETELPPPRQIIAQPLDDRSLEVRWTFPRNRSVSGSVVEWFAVRQGTGSILHWEKLNSSCTKLVMTEGVKPMECYAVSVRILYGEQGAGTNRTLHIYTRQGTPSAGPNVTVQHISGGRVELSWDPVPPELLRGFLCNYTLFYSTLNQAAKSVLVPGHVHRYTLENLWPGNYNIFMRANTAAGSGPAGTTANVYIASEQMPVVMAVVVPLMMSFLVLMACLIQIKMMKHKLCQEIPDPSNSSLSRWTPETILKNKKLFMIQEKPNIVYSEVILLDKLQDLEDDQSYQRVQGLQTSSFHQVSSEEALTSGVAEAEETSDTDLSISPCIYSEILLPQTLPNLPTTFMSSSSHQSSDCEPTTTCYNDIILQPNRGTRSSCLGPSDEKRSCFPPKHLHSLVTFSHSGSSSHSSALFSQQNELSRLNPALPLQPTTICQPHVSFDSFLKSISLCPPSSLVDSTDTSMLCDPYIPI